VHHAREAIEVAAPVGAETVLARAQFTIGFVRGVTGGVEEGTSALQQALAASRQSGDVVHHSLALTVAGLIKNWEGEVGAADALQAEALTIARAHNLLMPLLFNAFLRGLTLTRTGDYAAALATLQEGLDLAEKVGDEVTHHRRL